MNRQLILAAVTPISAAGRVFDNRQRFFASGTLVSAASLQ
jgi:hypothetical protein